MEKALKSLFLSFLLCFYSFSYAGTKLSEEQCGAFGAFAANTSLTLLRGAKASELLKQMREYKDFKKLPKDIQTLNLLTVQLVDSFGPDVSPEEHFQGAASFCLTVGGDVDIMIKSITDTLKLKEI